ncbi:MAG: hypothetical protein AAF288_03175 [Planctomycetota bacterium]
MTPFSTDRDLLLLEPELFGDLAFFAQLRVSVDDAELADTTLTSIDADFDTAQIDPGHVALIDRQPCEVTQRLDAMSLTVSLLRSTPTDPAIPPIPQGQNRTLRIRTFAPQAVGVAHDLLRALGIDPDEPNAVELGKPTADSVLSLNLMARLEALGTLHRLYAAASAVDERQDAFSEKAEHYRTAFRSAMASASVLIDVNHDGLPEERRAFASGRLLRA